MKKTKSETEFSTSVSSIELLDTYPTLKYFSSITWAVFNCIESDKRKGRKAVLNKFGKSGWEKVLNINRTGIMAMLRVSPTPETQLYANTVAISADARFVKKYNAKDDEPHK